MYTTVEFVRNCLPEIRKEFHKFDRGRLFLAAGSYGMAGACIMAAEAALRSGVGYLDICIPKSIYPIVSVKIPEAVYTLYDDTDPMALSEKIRGAVRKADAVLFGCGLSGLSKPLSEIVFPVCEKKLLLDADGLSVLSENRHLIPDTCEIGITPHEGEMRRLLSVTEREYVMKNRLKCALQAAESFGVSVLLKGPETLIISKDTVKMTTNPTGNAGLGRAGSGDTLSGIIGSLLSQGTEMFEALAAGAYIHGMAADLLKDTFGIRSMLPTDIPSILPKVFRTIEGSEKP